MYCMAITESCSIAHKSSLRKVAERAYNSRRYLQKPTPDCEKLKCGGHFFHFFKAFCDLPGDNYIDQAADVITKLKHQHIYSNFKY